MRSLTRVASFLVLLGVSLEALAYVGPGLGAGALAIVLGIVAGILMLIVGVVWYPLKRLYRRYRERR